jgi:hypothetical protein
MDAGIRWISPLLSKGEDMARFQTGCTALLALAFATACAKDASNEGLVAPASSASEASGSSGSNSDRDSDSDTDAEGDRHVALKDDCDPTDPTWAPVGCFRRRGNVSLLEFQGEVRSNLAAAVVGHQAWRIDPTYIVLRQGRSIHVKNVGGRPHTFTRVAAFGAGRIPPLSFGLSSTLPAPSAVEECGASATDLPAGATQKVSGLAAGNHRFMCCFHPWMRAVVKVQ